MSELILNQGRGKEEKKTNRTSNLFSWLRYLVLLLIIFFIFRYAVGITIVNGNSMNPTLKSNDLILTSNIFFNIDRGDIVVVQDPRGFDIIKRVIALPNETVEIKSGTVFVNDEPLSENYISGTSFDIEKTIIPEGSYFIIGDNRTPGESLDSRDESIGPIPSEAVEGKKILSIFPFSIN